MKRYTAGSVGGAVLVLLGACAASPEARVEARPAEAPAVVAPPPGTAAAPAADKPETRNPFDYGATQPVRADTNAQTASVGQALKDKNHPERLSPLIAPKPFDLAAYRKDPKAYLDVVEPGRVFQVAQPGAEVRRIQPIGDAQVTIPQGTETTLTVKIEPGMPATFTSFDTGRFANKLTSITVAADERGLASTTFIAASGTIDEVKILAGCPVTSGQVTYRIMITR